MTEMVTSGSMSGDKKRSDGLLGESDNERRRSQSAPPVLHATALVLDSTAQSVLGGHTECSVERPAVPQRHALGEGLERPGMVWGLGQAGLEDRDRAVLHQEAGEVRAGSYAHPQGLHRGPPRLRARRWSPSPTAVVR